MKVISIKEPWASLIKEGIKQIETRSWPTKYRGELYIHTSKKVLTKNEQYIYKSQLALLESVDLKYGNIIAKCNLVDCKLMTEKLISEIQKDNIEYLCGEYKVGNYAWYLESIVKLEKPILTKGQLGIWNYEEEIGVEK